MAEIIRFKGSNCSLFSNAAHLSFHQRVNERFSLLAKPEVYRIEDVYANYVVSIDNETERTREGTGTSKTVDLDLLDRKRDLLVQHMFMLLKSAELSPVEAEAEAAAVLKPVLAPYKNVTREAYDSESALIISMLHDLNKDEYAEYVSALGWSSTLEAIEAANNEFKQKKDERTGEYMARKLESAKVLRQRTDDAYQLLCDYIYANQLLLPEGGSLVALNKLVEEVNAIIDEANAAHNRSKALRKSKKKDVLPEESEEGKGESFEPIPAK